MRLEQALERAAERSGWFSGEEGMRLAALAAEVPSHHAIVEIGAFAGRSTGFLVAGAQNGLRAHIISLDDWGPAALPDGTDQSAADAVLAEYLEHVDMTQVTPIRARSTDLEKFWVQPIGLLFLDATHLYEDTLHDLNAWERHVVGKMALHDYHPDHSGVVRAVDEFAGVEARWEKESIVGSLCTLRRTR